MRYLSVKDRASLQSTKSAILFAVIFTLIPLHSVAQLGDFGDLLMGGIEDGEKLASEYFQPFGSGFGADINTGWVDGASTHDFLGFSVNIRLSSALAPESDRTFDVSQVDLKRLRIADPQGSTSSPTVSGLTDDGPMMEAIVSEETIVSSFPMPEGLGLRFIPAAMIQGNIGIGFGSELMIRYLPPIVDVDDLYIGLIGLGLKHELNQYLPGGELLPITISLMAGFTNLTATFDEFMMEPADYNMTEPHNINEFPTTTWEDQELIFSNYSWNTNLLVGYDLPFISLHGGIGIEGSNMNTLAQGDYPFVEPDPTPEEPNRTRIEVENNPIDISITGTNNFRGLIGAQLRFGLAYFSLEYTYSDYQAINGGFGVTFR